MVHKAEAKRENAQSNDGETLQAVNFDVDGTLAETELAGHRVAFNRAFAEAGLPWRWSAERYRQLLAVTGGKERIRHYVARNDPQRQERAGFDTWVADLHRRKSAIYSELVRCGAIALRPGVARLIGELRSAGVRLAIATTTTPSSLDSLIMANFRCATSALFEVIGAGDIVANKKPAPDIYRWVLAQLRLPPHACLAIEDSFAGLCAARAAGLPSLITVNAATADDDFSGALCVLSDLGEADAPARSIDGVPLAGPCVDVAQLRARPRQQRATPGANI